MRIDIVIIVAEVMDIILMIVFMMEQMEGHSSYSRGTGTQVPTGMWWIGYVIALVIGYGINELLGVIILIGLAFWLAAS